MAARGGFGGQAYRVVLIAECSEGSQKVPGVVGDAGLRDDATPVRDVGIVTEGEDTRRRQLRGEEGLGPRLRRPRRRPRLFSSAGKAMDEDNAANYLIVSGSSQPD
jgi:hypothetical protein